MPRRWQIPAIDSSICLTAASRESNWVSRTSISNHAWHGTLFTAPGAMRKTPVDSPRGKFTLSAAGNPVQDMYLREVKGNNNEFRGVAVKALADPARGCKL